MADRTSAGLFGLFFQQLADDLTLASADVVHADRREYILTLARELWPQIWQYDFSEYQMGADEALIQLGLARKTPEGLQYMNREMTDWTQWE